MGDLDPTARESNFRDSVKKYFVDNLYKTEKVEVLFDRTLSTPKVQGTEVDRWIAVMLGDFDLGIMGTAILEIFCCTKKDSEGFKLAQVRDKVMGYLIDTTQTDGMARIPLYRSSATEAWTVVGSMLVQVDSESGQMEAEDGTKFKTITVSLRWATK